jgi:predicted transcriptional regulator
VNKSFIFFLLNLLITLNIFNISQKLKKRAELGIFSLILEACSTDAYDTKKTTVIMYYTLLKHAGLKEYWNGLIRQGLIMYDNTTQTFKTTEKGLKFLEVFSKLDRYQEKRKNNNRALNRPILLH